MSLQLENEELVDLKLNNNECLSLPFNLLDRSIVIRNMFLQKNSDNDEVVLNHEFCDEDVFQYILEYLEHYKGLCIKDDKTLTKDELLEEMKNSDSYKKTDDNEKSMVIDLDYETLYQEKEEISRREFNEWDNKFFGQFTYENTQATEDVKPLFEKIQIFLGAC